MSACKNWCFTINNPTPLEKIELNGLHTHNNVNFIIYQLEAGDNATPHYQGYIQLKQRKRLNQVKEFIGSRAHLEVAKGSVEDNIKYCSKEPRLEDTVLYGEPQQVGRRNDIIKFRDAMKTRVLSESEIFEEYPEIICKYPRFVKSLRDHYAEASINTPIFTPRFGWQLNLQQRLLEPAHDREVIWVVDPIGNTGKSTFARNWKDRESFIITGGRHQDIYYAYGRQPVVFFDLARVARDKVPYEVMENFKNGGFLSTKYESRWIKFEIPHVVVFANFQPERTSLSEDRWNIIEI